jgi:hypothetical protein
MITLRLIGRKLTVEYPKDLHWEGPLLFLVYINDLPLSLNIISTPILFADDTSVLITSQNPKEFNIVTNEILQKLGNRFKTNVLLLNYEKNTFHSF